MNEFKIGDVVCLKSGGVDMTVLEVHSTGNFLTVVWFNETTGLISSQPNVPTFIFNKVSVNE